MKKTKYLSNPAKNGVEINRKTLLVVFESSGIYFWVGFHNIAQTHNTFGNL